MHNKELSQDTLALILAGGNGTRLGSLTRWQCKPAIPFAGHFRNIDFTLSNCLNSQVRRVGVLTQYKAQTLIGHINQGWNVVSRRSGEFVDVWPAQQRTHKEWYAGTADAVLQNLDLILAQRTKYTLVLAGDHIYKMDYRRLLEQHAGNGADITVGAIPVPIEEASAFGVLGIDARGRVRTFIEKPAPSALNTTQPTVIASMGIYVFNTDYLVERLTRDARSAVSAHDFGKDILPAAVRDSRVDAFLFTEPDGRPAYWRDVGTIDAYWQAHMELLSPEPPLDLYDSHWPIGTLPEQLPPAKLIFDHVRSGFVANSMLSGGVVVRGARVTESVLSSNVVVDCGAAIDQAVLLPGARIGEGCDIRRAIVDTNVIVPPGTMIGHGDSGPISLVTRESLDAMLDSDSAASSAA
jgi:glucose-1-phosphate adenylyltransferase